MIFIVFFTLFGSHAVDYLCMLLSTPKKKQGQTSISNSVASSSISVFVLLNLIYVENHTWFNFQKNINFILRWLFFFNHSNSFCQDVSKICNTIDQNGRSESSSIIFNISSRAGNLNGFTILVKIHLLDPNSWNLHF